MRKFTKKKLCILCAEHFLIFNSEIATENWAILIKRWGISFEDAVENPNHRIEAANIIMHPQYEVNIVFFLHFVAKSITQARHYW